MNGKKPRGTWGIRVLIHGFTFLLGVLVFWLLGFVVDDIESVRGPDYGEIERGFQDPSLVERQERLVKQIAELERDIGNHRAQQQLVGDSSQNLQRTINQLLELQRLSIQKQVSLSDAEKNNLSISLARFLESQKSYQDLNQKIADLTAKRQSQEEERRTVEQQLAQQRAPANQEFQQRMATHRLRLAMYQLAVLVPLLLAAGYTLLRWRNSLYFPLILAWGVATLLKVGLVIHEYFPSQYVKYVLLVLLLAVVARVLVHFIRIVTFPKQDWLMKQYREAYERFLCPICEYPIRTGPRRFLYWTRRTVHKILPQGESTWKEEPYTCPSCGTTLNQTCPACQKVRHSLLAFCEHCGAKQEVA